MRFRPQSVDELDPNIRWGIKMRLRLIEEADAPFLSGAMRHSQHALGAPTGRCWRNAVRPRLRSRGFSRRAGRQG